MSAETETPFLNTRSFAMVLTGNRGTPSREIMPTHSNFLKQGFVIILIFYD